MKEVKTPKKPLAIYYAIVLVILLVLNFVVVPWASERQIKEVDYGTSAGWTLNPTRSYLPIKRTRRCIRPAS